MTDPLPLAPERARATLITGASSGIGATLARRLAAPGAQLTLTARHARDALEAVAADVRARGAEVELVMGDLVDEATAPAAVAATVARFGRLDAVVANAGFPLMRSYDEGEMADIEYAFRGNLFSLFGLVRAAQPHLTQATDARVIAVGSFTAHVFRTDLPSFPMSAASKGGVETAVRSLALALAKDAVTVNCVTPGLIYKDEGTRDALDPAVLAQLADKIPLNRIGAQDEVAATLEFLLSPAAGYITGQVVHVNGGLI